MLAQRDMQVEIPEDLLWALDANAKAQAIFDRFPSSYRRQFVSWIESARRADIRAERVQDALKLIIAEKKLA